MKLYCCLLLLSLAVVIQAQEATRPPTRPPPTTCQSADDCEEDECCVATGLDIWFGRGRCRKLKQEGDRCLPQIGDQEGSGIFHFSCPCADGLECVGEETEVEDLGVIHTNPTCQTPE